MNAVTEFLSGINIWLAIVIVDAFVGIMVYAFFCAGAILRSSYYELNGIEEEYTEEGDFPNDSEEEWFEHGLSPAGAEKPCRR